MPKKSRRAGANQPARNRVISGNNSTATDKPDPRLLQLQQQHRAPPAREPRELLDRRRLVRILALLSSEHDREAAAAGRHATAILRAAGATWSELIDPPRVVKFPPPPTPPRPWLRIHRIIAAAALCPARLTEDERAFIRDLIERKPRNLAAFDLSTLERIGDRFGLVRAAHPDVLDDGGGP